jgi:hypothetical protein
MRKKRIYISGAISGVRRHEYMWRFADMERILIKRGHDVVNPTKLWPCKHSWVYPALVWLLGGKAAYRLVIRYDLFWLRRCDAIYMMWLSDRSRGARLERMKAAQWGKEILNYENL